MANSDDYQRDVAGRFMQASRNMTFELTHRLFPEIAAEVTDVAEREVEDNGLQEEGIEVIRHWFHADADAEWLDRFWQSPEGRRFMELSVELMTRATIRRFSPGLPLPPPSGT